MAKKSKLYLRWINLALVLVVLVGCKLEGQYILRNPSTNPSPTPTPTPQPPGPTQIGTPTIQLVTGDLHNCYQYANGNVKCWGSNTNGQLGVGDTVNRGISPGDITAMSPIPLGEPSFKIDAGVGFSCSLSVYGNVKCWGLNSVGQLGQDTLAAQIGGIAGDMTSLNPIFLGKKAVDLAVGWDHACALLEDNTVKCWGGNLYGQLGQDNTVNLGDGSVLMETVPALTISGGTIAQIDAGRYTSCVKFTTNQMKCWGRGAEAALGTETTQDRGRGAAPNSLADAINAVLQPGMAVADMGLNWHSCVATTDGRALCWGYNNNGQVGQNSATPTLGTTAGSITGMTPIVFPSNIVKIAAGDVHTCAVMANGSLRCWGNNANGQLGLNNTVPARIGDATNLMSTLVDITYPGKTAVDVSCGTKHNCVLFNDGTVRCWGWSDFGQLGMGNTTGYGMNGTNTVQTATDVPL